MEKLLRKSEVLYAEPDQEIYDKEFFGFTYGHYGRLLSQSSSWLPQGSNTVHPMQGSPFKSMSQHKLSVAGAVSKALSSHRPSVPARVASSLGLNVASTALPAQRQSFFSGDSSKHQLSMQSKDQLSMQSRALSSPKHHLPARRASILKLNIGSGEQTGQQHALPKTGRTALHFDLSSPPSSVDSRHSSWLSMGNNTVHPFTSNTPQSVHQLSDDTVQPEPAPTKSSQLPSPHRSMLQSRTSSASLPQPNRPLRAFSPVQTSPRAELPRTRSILRSKSSLTAASVFDAGLNMSSSDDGSLAVPEDLIDSAMFLLRDLSLANPDAQVSAMSAEDTKHAQFTIACKIYKACKQGTYYCIFLV